MNKNHQTKDFIQEYIFLSKNINWADVVFKGIIGATIGSYWTKIVLDFLNK